MAVRACVNIAGGVDQVEEYLDFEICPSVGEEVIFEQRLPGGGGRLVSGKVERIQHHGVLEGSSDKPYVGIWAKAT